MNRTRHHLLFPRAEWELRPQATEIRRTPSLIPAMDRESHDYIHGVIPLIPLIGHHTLLAVNRFWTPTGDTMADIDGLCLGIERASAPSRVHPIERDLAGLAIEAMMLQKETLKDIL